MKNFDIHRFWNVMKWYFHENRGTILKWTAAAATVTVLLQLFFVNTINTSVSASSEEANVSPYAMGVAITQVFCIMALGFCIYLVNSNVFGWMKNKQKRIAFLTLPATNMERWTTAVLYAAIIIPVCIVAGWLVGDVLRNVVFCLQGEQWLWAFNAFEHMPNYKGFHGLSSLTNCASWLWWGSLFILGGTWFRKGQFAITFFLQLAFSLITSVLANVCHMPILNLSGFNIDGESELTNIVRLAILTVFIIVNLCLSYHIFKRFQITTSKWTNL